MHGTEIQLPFVGPTETIWKQFFTSKLQINLNLPLKQYHFFPLPVLFVAFQINLFVFLGRQVELEGNSFLLECLKAFKNMVYYLIHIFWMIQNFQPYILLKNHYYTQFSKIVLTRLLTAWLSVHHTQYQQCLWPCLSRLK